MKAILVSQALGMLKVFIKILIIITGAKVHTTHAFLLTSLPWVIGNVILSVYIILC